MLFRSGREAAAAQEQAAVPAGAAAAEEEKPFYKKLWPFGDRKSVVEGKSVDLGAGPSLKKHTVTHSSKPSRAHMTSRTP